MPENNNSSGSILPLILFGCHLGFYIGYQDSGCRDLLNVSLISIVLFGCSFLTICCIPCFYSARNALCATVSIYIYIILLFLTEVGNVIYASIAVFEINFQCAERPLWVFHVVILAINYFGLAIALCLGCCASCSFWVLKQSGGGSQQAVIPTTSVSAPGVPQVQIIAK